MDQEDQDRETLAGIKAATPAQQAEQTAVARRFLAEFTAITEAITSPHESVTHPAERAICYTAEAVSLAVTALLAVATEECQRIGASDVSVDDAAIQPLHAAAESVGAVAAQFMAQSAESHALDAVQHGMNVGMKAGWRALQIAELRRRES